MSNEKLKFAFLPSLVSQLLSAEKDKGAPLTKDEVIKIRDTSEVVALKPHLFEEFETKRG